MNKPIFLHTNLHNEKYHISIVSLLINFHGVLYFVCLLVVVVDFHGVSITIFKF